MMVIIRWILIPSILFLSPLTHAGNEKGGGGISENNILFAYWNLEKFIDLCRASPGCGLTTEESETLGRIRENLPRERQTKNQIVFQSGDKEPGFFVIDGLLRIAKTGYFVGDIIHVNTDLLYPTVTLNFVGVPAYGRPFDIPQAVSLLVHEFGHHLGIKNHTALDLLGSKVQSLMRTNTQEVDGGPEERHLIATAIDYGGVSEADLLIRDQMRVLSLASQLRAALRCPTQKGPVKGFWLWNLHWKRYRFNAPGKFIRPLRARAQLLCGEVPEQESIPVEIEVELIAQRSKAGPLEWRDGPFVIRQIDCGANPKLCP